MNRKKLNILLGVHEGRENKLYKDSVGKWSIGIGRNLQDRGLSEDEIDYLFNNDVEAHYAETLTAFPWVSDLDNVRQNVIIEMVFNMGAPRVKRFKNTLRATREGRYKDAKKGMLNSKWARQVGNRAEVLAKMMETGEWPKEAHYN